MSDQSQGTGTPNPEELDELGALFLRGHYLDAFNTCRRFAPLAEWQGTAALIMAGRLAHQWGDAGLATRLHQRAYRADPDDWMAALYQAYVVWQKHGEFEALQFVRGRATKLTSPPETLPQAYFAMLHARLLACFRDFDTADPIVASLTNSFPDDPWLPVDRAAFLEARDDYAGALAAAEEALNLQPWYRPAVQTRAHLLQLQERDEESVAFLREALDHLQSGSTVQMLVSMLEDEGQTDEIPPLLDLVAAYLPMPADNQRRWLSARRSLTAHLHGDRDEALRWARETGTDYQRKLVERLERATGPGRRVHLPVGFIRQHHMTCAPATLTAISQFWNVPADHLAIAREICYDGSPDHIERDWSERNGWLVREFRPTWETATALLDRGCPFAVVTVETDSAHMQAVIGYDAVLETLLVRDPFQRRFSEWLAPEFLKSYAAHGPRAMLMIPPDRTDLLNGLELADAELYDDYYQVRRSLHAHHRATAATALAGMQERDPDHLLTLWADYELAFYDDRQFDALRCVSRIRASYPENDNWRLIELRLRERLEDQVEHRRLLHEIGESRLALISLRRDYAEDLARDARHQTRARRILRSLLRRQATEPRNLHAYANLLWNEREFEEATWVYRLAAARAEKTEYHWESYFTASRHLGRAEECLAALRSRVDRWGAQSSLPVRTLFDSLNALDRTDEGFAALSQSLLLRPDDGDLRLYAAEVHSRFGRRTEAHELLAAASDHAARPAWLRVAAKIADYECDHSRALAHWQELVNQNPADIPAHQAVARLLAITTGDAAAVQHLREACAARPRLLTLYQLLVQRLRDSAADDALIVVDRMLELDPHDAWALREKALILRRLRRLDDALACAEEAMRIAPNAPSSHGIRADMLRELGRTDEAHAGYQAGIRLSIDTDWLFDSLLDSCADFAARREAANFLHGELLRQNSLDHACLTFRTAVRVVVEVAALTAMLREYHAANPTQWAAWSALGIHLLEAGETDEAFKIMRGATEQFPLVPRVWIDLAQVHAKREDSPARIKAIEKALSINPSWAYASRELSSTYEQLLRLDDAEHVLRRAIASNPLDAVDHARLGDVLWRLRRPEEAFSAIESALALAPDYHWAWEKLQDWSQQAEQPDRPRQLAQSFTESRAGEAVSWMRLVRMRFGDADLTDNLAALDRAAKLTPLDSELWDLRANLLAVNRRYDEALLACQPTVYGDNVPHVLAGRAAWIEHRRGRVDDAISALQKVVEAHPDYRWGWSLLTEWLWEKQRFDEVKKAAERWAWLDPHDAAPQGYLASVHLHAKRRSEAKTALRAAIAIDPQYAWGVGELLKLLLEDDDFDGARQVVAHYAAHYPPWETLRAQARVQLAELDRKSFANTLAQLALQPAPAANAFKQTVTLAFGSRWFKTVEKALAPLLANESALPVVGEQWVEARRQRDRLDLTLWRMTRLKSTPVQRTAVLGAVVSWLGEENRLTRLQFTIMRWKRELRADTESWGLTGYALASCSGFGATTRWLADWRQRKPPAEPWILLNLVLSLESVGRPEEAVAVADAAIALPPDHTHEKLLAWRAVEHALAGEAGPATTLLEKINTTDWTNYYQTLPKLARILVGLKQHPPAERRGASHQAQSDLRQVACDQACISTDPAMRRLYRRCLARIGRDAGRPWLIWRSKLPGIVPGNPNHGGFGLALIVTIVLFQIIRALW